MKNYAYKRLPDHEREKYLPIYEIPKDEEGDKSTSSGEKIYKSHKTYNNTVSSIIKIFNGKIVDNCTDEIFIYDIIHIQ